MRRVLIPAVPLFVAAAVLVLTSPALRAQQEHDHGAAAATGHSCACCGKTGSTAMNHASAGGCCGTGAAHAADPAVDHSEHTQDPAATVAQKPGNQPGAGCCSTMKAEARAEEHGAGCCGKTIETTATTPMKRDAHGCCGAMAMSKGDGNAPAAGEDPTVQED